MFQNMFRVRREFGVALCVIIFFVSACTTTVPIQKAVPSADTSHNDAMSAMDEMINSLVKKIQDDPSNAKLWLMLARGYVYTNRYPDAVYAYEHAETLTDPPDAQVLTEYAHALSMANDDRMAGAPERLIAKALKLQPNNPNTLWLAGMAAFQKANYTVALNYWEPLQKVTKPGSAEERLLADYMLQARTGERRSK